MNKKGVSQLIAGILLVVFVITISLIIFSFMFKTATQETSKSADKAFALDICRENVKIRVNNVNAEFGEDLKINLENLKERDITDFIIRLEKGNQVDITKKGGQILGGYEKIVLSGIENKFDTDLEIVKVIPQITLQRPELTSMSEGWWLCSDQMAVYKL